MIHMIFLADRDHLIHIDTPVRVLSQDWGGGGGVSTQNQLELLMSV